MGNRRLKVNLVLSGGGIKGIAYSGVFEAGERFGFRWANIVGVSAGALAGAYAGAGYTSKELLEILNEFDFSALDINEASKRLPVVEKFINYQKNAAFRGDKSIEEFLNGGNAYKRPMGVISLEESRGILKNIVTYSKEGCLFDGDGLEEWVYRSLEKKGVRTFADLRGGICDKVNPRGYKVRMTAVDATRRKIIVLPDDIAFYGIDPDRLEVARAVRMSTSVPFAFKPVELKKVEGGSTKTYNIVDGGVLDNFPYWLIAKSRRIPTVGFKLSGGEKKKLLSLDTPINIVQGLVNAVHDTGVPEEKEDIEFLGKIDTSRVDFLDFALDKNKKEYLYLAGRKSGVFVFEAVRRKYRPARINIIEFFQRLFWR